MLRGPSYSIEELDLPYLYLQSHPGTKMRIALRMSGSLMLDDVHLPAREGLPPVQKLSKYSVTWRCRH